MTHLWHRNGRLPFSWSLLAQSPQTRSWGWACLLCGTGNSVPQCFCLLQEPQPQHPTQGFRRTTVLGQSTRGLCGEPPSQQTHIQIVPQRVGSCFGVTIGQSVSVVPPGNCSARFFLRVSRKVFIFLRGKLSPRITTRNKGEDTLAVRVKV